MISNTSKPGSVLKELSVLPTRGWTFIHQAERGCHRIISLIPHFPSVHKGTGRPTKTGRAAPVAGPALGPWPWPGPWPAVAGVWPGMLRRLNLGTTATLTLRLGKAYRWPGERETEHRAVSLTVKEDTFENEIWDTKHHLKLKSTGAGSFTKAGYNEKNVLEHVFAC